MTCCFWLFLKLHFLFQLTAEVVLHQCDVTCQTEVFVNGSLMADMLSSDYQIKKAMHEKKPHSLMLSTLMFSNQTDRFDNVNSSTQMVAVPMFQYTIALLNTVQHLEKRIQGRS